MQTKNIWKLLVLALVAIMLGVFTHCVPTSNMRGPSSQTMEKNILVPSPEVTKTPEQVINEVQVATGIKHHEQILQTMATLTGVPSTTPSVQTVYKDVAESLPTENDIKTFLTPHQVAVTKLAAQFCEVLIEDPTFVNQRSRIWPSFNFTSLPVAALTSNNVDVIIDQTLTAFWGTNVVSDIELQEARLDLRDLVFGTNGIVAGEAASGLTTRNVVKGICLSTLSSAYVTFL